MSEALEVFVAGLGGVFIGMTLLYVAIRLTRAVSEGLWKGGPDGD